MSNKARKGLWLLSAITAVLLLFYVNLEDYQEQRIHMLINDFLLSRY
ncbi:hypothetical protein [Planctobacterium marinum]